MIAIAQDGVYFSGIKYLEDKDFVIYDLDKLEISHIRSSKALQEFVTVNADKLIQQAYRGLEIIVPKEPREGYIIRLEREFHPSKKQPLGAKWTYTQNNLEVVLDDLNLHYNVSLHRKLFGYQLDFSLNDIKLVSNLPFKAVRELESPLDHAYLHICTVVDTPAIKMSVIFIDLVGTTFHTVIAYTPQRVLLADLVENKFVPLV